MFGLGITAKTGYPRKAFHVKQVWTLLQRGPDTTSNFQHLITDAVLTADF